MTRSTIKDWGKGINKDQPPFELAPGFWSDCQNMRFRNGKAERVGGIASVLTPSITPYALLGYSSGATKYVFYMGTTKAYVHDGTTETEITRQSLPTVKTISSATHSGGTVSITTSTAHGLSTGNIVTTSGFKGDRYNKVNATITVTSTTVFTFVPDSGAIANTASTIGVYTIVSGSGSTNNFTGTADDKLTCGNFNGVLWVNSPADGLYYWDQTISTGKLVQFPGTQYKALFARAFKNYIIQGGRTIGSTLYRHRLSWSSAAEPGSIPTEWTASDTNDAGDLDLVSSVEMVDGMEWGETFQVYKGDVRFGLSYIGGNFVFDTKQVSVYSKDDGLLAANCVVNTPKGQVFISSGLDIRIHQGGQSQSIAEGRILKSFRSRINTTNRKRSFVEVNPYTKEVWVCFPETGQSTCTKAFIWNWDDDTWGERDLTTATCAASGYFPTSIATEPRMLIGNTTPRIALVDSGTTDYGSSFTSMLERIGMDVDSPMWKTLHTSYPIFDGSTNFTASIFHGSAPTQDGTVTYASSQTYTHNTTKKVCAFAYSGPYLAWKMTTTASDTPSLRTLGLEWTEDGTD